MGLEPTRGFLNLRVYKTRPVATEAPRHFFKLVEPRVIKTLSQSCEDCVLSLNYGPIFKFLSTVGVAHMVSILRAGNDSESSRGYLTRQLCWIRFPVVLAANIRLVLKLGWYTNLEIVPQAPQA